MIKKETKELELGIDAPLENPSDDCLDRALFAKRIFRVIEGTPVSTNMTVGIHGSWGSGKTTAMNFLRWYCKEAGHPVALFSPWQFQNRQMAWNGFISSIDKGIAEWQGKKIGTFKRQKAVKKISKEFRKVTAITEVGKIAGDLILAPLEGLLEQTKDKVQKELNKTLKGKRLFIFIDDLDRAEPEILYELLMLLNEIVNLSRCIFVIGLDVNMAYQIIEKKIGLLDSQEFLEKIINWPFDLPEPTDFEWQELLDKEIEELDNGVKKAVLQSILPYLPRNPRKFKHFLRYISGLHRSFLSRFDESELDWKVLYLAQLIKIDFPKIFQRIISNEEILNDISSGTVLDHIRKIHQSPQEGEETPEWTQKINDISKDMDEAKKERLLTLYIGLRESTVFITQEEQLKNHLLVIEVPELFTWREYNSFKKELVSLTNGELLEKLRNFIKQGSKDKEIESTREFFKMLVKERELLFTQAIDAIDQEKEMKPLLNDVKDIMRICFWVLDIDDIFQGHNPIFNKEVFKEWYEKLSKWTYFKEPEELYAEIRELEAELAKKLAVKLFPQSSSILEILYHSSFDSNFSDDKKAFKGTHKEVKEILEKALSEQIIDRFKRVDGIKELWGKDSYIPEKRLLFYKHPVFHNKNIYDKLREISKEASTNLEIQKNFVEYIRMLFYASTEHVGWAEQENTKKLLEEKEFMDIVWKAAVSRRMNRRMVGDIERDRKKIIKEVLQDEKALPVPKWWTELISDVEGENQIYMKSILKNIEQEE